MRNKKKELNDLFNILIPHNEIFIETKTIKRRFGILLSDLDELFGKKRFGCVKS